MFVKKFAAPTLEDALRAVKKEFGDSALILSSVSHKGTLLKKGSVEVMAAKDKDKKPTPKPAVTKEDLERIFPHRRAANAQRKAQQILSQTQNQNPPLQQAPNTPSRYIDVGALPNPVQATPRRNSSERFEEAFLKAGFSLDSARELSHRLMMDFPKNELEHPISLEKLRARVVANSIRTVPAEFIVNQKNFVAMGPPGSGKTSYLVKLCLFLRDKGLNTALASRERRKITGAGEMAQYAKIIKVPFAHDLKEKNKDRCTLVDVSAIGSQQSDFKDDMERLLNSLDRPSPILVLDATQRHTELMQIADLVERFNPVAVAFTKVDLAANFGGIYEFLKKTRLPLLSLSVSDSFKSALRFMGQLDLAKFILAGGRA